MDDLELSVLDVEGLESDFKKRLLSSSVVKAAPDFLGDDDPSPELLSVLLERDNRRSKTEVSRGRGLLVPLVFLSLSPMEELEEERLKG